MDGRKYARIILNILVPVLTVYVIVVWGPRLILYFMPFVIGWVIAMIANPPVRFLEKKLRIVRRHSSVVLIVGVLTLVITGIYLLTAWGLRELSGFLRELPELYGVASREITAAWQRLSGTLSFIPDDVGIPFARMTENLSASIAEFLQEVASSAGGAVVRTIPELFVNTIVVLLSSYLFLAEHDKLTAAAKRYLPASVKRYWEMFHRDIGTVIGGYFLAQLKIMVVMAMILFAGFLLLGLRYSIFLAVGIAFLDFLPMFGTGTALFPWALVKLFEGDYMYALELIGLYVVTQAVRQIIQPKIVGDTLGLPPLTTLFFLFIGFRVRGIAGMILAVPVGLVIIKFYEYGAFDSFLENVRLLIEEVKKLRKGEDG